MPATTQAQLPYSTIFELMTDVQFYLALRVGSPLTLSLVTPVVRNRWPWMVRNWPKLYQRFQAVAAGNDTLEETLVEFSRMIDSYNLGNLKNPFDDSNKIAQFFPFLNSLQLSDLGLTPDERVFLDQEILRVRQLDVDQFRSMVLYLNQKLAVASATVGLGDADGARIFGAALVPRQRSFKVSDIGQMNDVISIKRTIEGIIIDLNETRQVAPNLLAIDNALIDPASQVRFFEGYKSYVPIAYEISLESMAQKYLGDKQRWYELVTINNLKPPYVDEQGEKFSLLAPAAVNNLVIENTRADRATVGTKVRVGSARYREETRIIERVIRNDNGTMVLFLSGAQDLNRFTTADLAYCRIFKPATTRSTELVLIPLVQASPQQGAKVPTPRDDELRRLGAALLSFGVDVARDERTNDFIVDASGNFKLIGGVQNVRQAVLYALRTQRGELPFHPNYGVNLGIGNKFFGTTDEALLFGAVIQETLIRDPRLQDVKISKISVNGNSIALQMLVRVSGANQPIPLSFIG